MASHLAQALVCGSEHRGHPLPLGVERGAPGLRGEVLGEGFTQACRDLVAGLGAPPHRAAVGEEEHGPHDPVAQRLRVAVGVVRGRAQDAVLTHLVAHERDGARVGTKRRAGQRQAAGGWLEGLTDAVAPRLRVPAVVDLVEDHQGRGVDRAAAVQRRVGGDLRIGERDTVVLVGLHPAGVGERGVEVDAHARRGIRPLGLQVLGGGDDGDRPDDAAVEQFGRDPQGVRGLAGAGGGDGEEVAALAAQVAGQRLFLPGAQLRSGSPRRPLGEGG